MLVDTKELDQDIQGALVFRFIESRKRLEWLGHVRRTDDSKTTKRIADFKAISIRNRVRSRKSWIDDVEDIMRKV